MKRNIDFSGRWNRFGNKELGEMLMAEYVEALKNPDPVEVRDVQKALESWEAIRGMEITV